MLCAQGLCTGRYLYRATPAVTRDLGFSCLIRKTAPFSRLLRHMRGCGGSILTWILTGDTRIRCKLHTIPILMQQIRISTNYVSPVIPMPKNLEIRYAMTVMI
jgi:hypothetical protein